MTPPGVTGFDALGGNMPFLGGRRIATAHGASYAAWLTNIHGGTGDTNYVGYFFLRATELVAGRGAVGFIATSAIAEGDSRRTTLARAVRSGFELYHVPVHRRPWEGGAATVLISVLHLARGSALAAVRQRILSGRRVAAINSRIRAGEERADPTPLIENTGLALVGCFLRGDGFVLENDEADALLAAHPKESAVVRPFLVGDDLNARPDQSPSRHVIAFFDRSLEEARRFPAAFRLVDERVRPERERLKAKGSDADHRKHWWRFANNRKELREVTAGRARVLATARVSKHVLVSFTSPAFVPSEQVVIFPLDGFCHFAILQSRVHEAWVRLLATSMGDGIRYSASECFDTFPFPVADPRAVIAELEGIGRRVCEQRTGYMLEHQLGLTETYNRIGDPKCRDAAVERLRQLHTELDRAVLAVYAWSELAVPTRAPVTHGERADVEAFHDEIVERLFELNERRTSGRAAERAHWPGVAKPRQERMPGVARARSPRNGSAATKRRTRPA